MPVNSLRVRGVDILLDAKTNSESLFKTCLDQILEVDFAIRGPFEAVPRFSYEALQQVCSSITTFMLSYVVACIVTLTYGTG